MKFNKNYLSYVLGIIGVFAALMVYNFVFLEYQNKTEMLELETNNLRKEIKELEEIAASADEYRNKMDQMNVEMAVTLEEFAKYYQMEDILMMTLDMKGGIDSIPKVDLLTEVSINSMTPELLYTTGTTSTLENMNLYAKAYDVNFKTTYAGMKDYVAYLYQTDTIKNISQIQFSFDGGTGLLTGNIAFNQFFITNTNEPYIDPIIPEVIIGTPNIFGETAVSNATDYQKLQERLAAEAAAEAEEVVEE